jgi:hypothetical protein
MMTRPKNRLHAQPLDKVITMNRNQPAELVKRESLKPLRNILITSLALANLLLTPNLGHSYALAPNVHEQEMWKLYAHMKIGKTSEFICLNELWTRESHWNPKAKGDHSTAYGIPQILGLKITDPYLQIDAGLKYIKHRYSSACVALKHSHKHGNY